ncbi:MAG: helicase-associated domain-containing protein [Treponema sp.]|nr:helicase-associated domain-containing protein [Treponema sp.]
MKNGIFRQTDFWKESMMTLPDSAFFELMRTVFGKIKTPYSKQTLMGDLEKFLSRSDIKKNIANYIDKNDRRIITAIASLEEPAPGELETFFSGEISYAKLTDSVVNLEERFIVYRFFEKGKGRLALNPVLKSILSPLAADKSLLFPSSGMEEIPPGKTVHLDDRMLAALLSFVSQNKDFYWSAGTIRRKILNSAKKAFPNLPLETIIGAMRILGLFYIKDEYLFPDYNRFESFDYLSRQERMEYCAAAIYCYRDSALKKDGRPAEENTPPGEGAFSISPWLLREKLRNCAVLMHQIICSLDAFTFYPIPALYRLMYMLNRGSAPVNGEMFIGAMENTGLIAMESDRCWLALTDSSSPKGDMSPKGDGSPKGDVPTKGDEPPREGAIAMDTPFSMLLYPEIAYNDAIDIAAFSRVIEAGMNIRFELTRDSAVSAFNRGITARIIIDLLRRLSHDRIDENLVFALHDWEKRHSEVVLRRGLLLTLSPERRYLADTRQLSALITETIAPGIYLLPETAEERVGDALRKAGVDIIARRVENNGADGDGLYGSTGRSYFPPLQTEALPGKAQRPSPSAKPGAEKEPPASTLIDGFHSILSTMNLGPEERDELAARIDRRLVLCESQLKGAIVRYEKLEARGLDYAGKALIAKQAIAMKSPVEVVCPGRKENIFGIPKALEKAGGESILVIELLDDKAETALQEAALHEAVRVPLGKISLLRRIKKSIFETVT